MENIILHVDCKGEALDQLQNRPASKSTFQMGMRKD